MWLSYSRRNFDIFMKPPRFINAFARIISPAVTNINPHTLLLLLYGARFSTNPLHLRLSLQILLSVSGFLTKIFLHISVLPRACPNHSTFTNEMTYGVRVLRISIK